MLQVIVAVMAKRNLPLPLGARELFGVPTSPKSERKWMRNKKESVRWRERGREREYLQREGRRLKKKIIVDFVSIKIK